MDTNGKQRVANLWVLTDTGLDLMLRDKRRDLWPALVETVNRLNQEVKEYVDQEYQSKKSS